MKPTNFSDNIQKLEESILSSTHSKLHSERETHRDSSGMHEVHKTPTLAQIYQNELDFVWQLLIRFGVKASDLEDVSQEVFVAIHKSLPSFRPESPLRPWIYGVALRVSSEFRRKAYRRYEKASDTVSDHLLEHTNPELLTAEKEACLRIEELLDELEEEKRAAFVMHEIDGFSCDEISVLAGVPKGTIHSRLHHARKELQELFLRASKRLVPAMNAKESP